jgi:Zincin-like metallopeptidase
VQVRSERRRDRRGRGLRGPLALPAPLDTAGARLRLSRSQRFDELALGIVDRLKRRWPSELSNVQFGVEETPPITHDWNHDPIPLAALVQPLDRKPARIVLYRRPIEFRARGISELAALLHEVVIERVADLLGKDPEEVDPRS